MWSFGGHQQDADIAFTCFVNGLPEAFGEATIEHVPRGVGRDDFADTVVPLEVDGSHAGSSSPAVAGVSSKLNKGFRFSNGFRVASNDSLERLRSRRAPAQIADAREIGIEADGRFCRRGAELRFCSGPGRLDTSPL